MPDQKEKYVQLDEVIARHRGEPGALMPVLQEAQNIFGYVPPVDAGEDRRRTGHHTERGVRRGDVLFPVLAGAQGTVRAWRVLGTAC